MMEGKEWKATAATVGPDEKAKVWPTITAKYKGYAGYQEKTDREIPVVRCTPA
jgi:hypothetical protein